jgi:SAM-dependent methyltransferase
VSPTTSGISNPDNHGYEPTDYWTIRKALKNLNLSWRDEVFVDYGSGKGRVVIFAATYPFRKVLGVEFSPELSAIAQQNIRKVEKKLKCHDIEIITADAGSFDLPNEASVLFLYNPFSGDLLKKVFDKIRTSLNRVPRKLLIVYKNPKHLNTANDLDWLEKRSEFQCFSKHPVVIFEAAN